MDHDEMNFEVRALVVDHCKDLTHVGNFEPQFLPKLSFGSGVEGFTCFEFSAGELPVPTMALVRGALAKQVGPTPLNDGRKHHDWFAHRRSSP